MSAADLHHKIADSYLQLFKNLSIEAQSAFIAKLSASLQKPQKASRSVEDYIGAWQSEESATEIIADISANRTFNRKIEEF
jgi:hypothetical protein